MKTHIQTTHYIVAIALGILSAIVLFHNNSFLQPGFFNKNTNIDSNYSHVNDSNSNIHILDSINKRNEAYGAVNKVIILLDRIKLGNISPDDQIKINDELGFNITLIEKYYRVTKDRQLGLIIIDFLNYFIPINEHDSNNKLDTNTIKAKSLLTQIKSECHV